MFLKVITEEQIRRDCPHNAPLTLRAFNKISPRQFNTSVSPLNPYEIPRYAPKTVGQFAKALVSQQRDNNGQPTNALAVAAVEQAVLAETEANDYVMFLGGEEEQKSSEMSIEQIREQIEILELSIDKNTSPQDLEVAMLTLEYYERLLFERGSDNIRPDYLQSEFSTEATGLLTHSQADMREQEAEAARESRGDAPAGVTAAEFAAFSPTYGALMSTSAAKEMDRRREATLPDVPRAVGRPTASQMRDQALRNEGEEVTSSGRPMASEMREQALRRESDQELQQRLDAIKLDKELMSYM